MLPFLRGKALPLAVQLLQGKSPACRQCVLTIRLYQRPPTLPLFHLSTRLGLHTSSQLQKRKREVKESVFIPTLQRHWQEIKKTPKPALFFGVLGAVPFALVPTTMCYMNTYYPDMATIQVLYGGCILSFLGGVRWGYTLPDGSPLQPTVGQLLTSIVPPYIAFVSLLMFHNVQAAIYGLGGGFIVSLLVDLFQTKQLELIALGPLWYKWLRVLLTVIVLGSLLGTIKCAKRYPKKTKEDLVAMLKERNIEWKPNTRW